MQMVLMWFTRFFFFSSPDQILFQFNCLAKLCQQWQYEKKTRKHKSIGFKCCDTITNDQPIFCRILLNYKRGNLKSERKWIIQRNKKWRNVIHCIFILINIASTWFLGLHFMNWGLNIDSISSGYVDWSCLILDSGEGFIGLL